LTRLSDQQADDRSSIERADVTLEIAKEIGKHRYLLGPFGCRRYTQRGVDNAGVEHLDIQHAWKTVRVNPVLVVAVSVAVGLAFFTSLIWFIRWLGRRAVAKVADDVELIGAIYSAAANMPGGQSSSGSHMGGVGVLAVFRDDVRFLLAVPRRTTVIPRASITSATIDAALKVPGRYQQRLGREFLVLRWSEAGTERAAGFLVADPQAMLAVMERPVR
jgi:hypothetical protein